MNFKLAIPADDRVEQGLLLLALICGLGFWADSFGYSVPYPGNAVLKASGIVLLGLYALKRGYLWLAAGLLFGSAGDAFLALEPMQLDLGIVSFGIGHLIFIGLFANIVKQKGLHSRSRNYKAALLAVYGVAMLMWLQPYFGDVKLAASIYNGIILVMAILAILGRPPAIALVGAILFVVSDTILALDIFVGILPDWAGPLNWLFYFSAQACLAIGLSKARS